MAKKSPIHSLRPVELFGEDWLYLVLNRDRLVTIQDIADMYGISKNHLMKVVHQLDFPASWKPFVAEAATCG
jgi:hypothetical protein